MARGGYRPGSGRKKGQKSGPREKSQSEIEREQIREKIRELLKQGTLGKAKIYSDLKNKIAKGESLSATEMKIWLSLGAELAAEVKEEDREELKEKLDPLEYALAIVSDPREDKDRRDRMAVAILPYLHPRKGEGQGKKDEKSDRAKAAGGGKFKAGRPPILKMVK
jgi:hypothetical protein